MKKYFILFCIIFLSFSQAFSQCSPSFTYKVDSLNDVVFTNLTTYVSGYSYQWDFGDSSLTDFSYHTTHHFLYSGIYLVTLSVYSVSGICGSYTDTVYVNYCDAQFTAQITNNVVKFKNNSAASPSTSYKWNFGDSSTSSSKNPTHSYQFTGLYFVMLTLYDSLSACSSFAIDSFFVSVPPCEANFNYSTKKDTLFIRNQASNYQLITYDFGDGTNSTNANPVHIYNQSGTYSVCQTVSDTLNNCTDSYCDSVTIYIPPPCQAGYTYKVNEDSLFIQNTASNYQTLHYDFGDGIISTTENPIHIYSQSGTYQVCQTVEDTLNNCFAVFCDSVSILIPPSCKAGFNYQFQADTSYFQNLAVNYDSLVYFFGDGDSSISINPVHLYIKSGIYIVEQKVFNHRNCISVFKDTIQVSISTSCVAKFEPALDTANPSTLFLINTSSDFKSSQYIWDFGDGSTSTQKNPTHQYAENKAYQICLTVSDSALNCMSFYCDTLGLDSSGNILKSSGFTLKVLDISVIGLEENSNPLEELVLFPNPASESISVKWPKSVGDLNYILYNINGQVVKSGELYKSRKKTIEIVQLKSGLYWIEIESDGNRLVRKIVKL